MKIFEIFEIENFRELNIFHFHTNFNENFENFRSQKFPDANFKLLQLFSFSIKLFDFFIDPCKISVRIDSRRLEALKNEPERVKRKCNCWCMNGDPELQIILTVYTAQLRGRIQL